MSDIYTAAREAFLTGAINVATADIRAVLTRGYTPNASTHDFLDDIPGGQRVATTALASSKTTTGGVFDSADLVFTAVAAGAACEAMVLYVDTGVEATSRLLAFYNAGGEGFPITPNGQDINITVNNWFTL